MVKVKIQLIRQDERTAAPRVLSQKTKVVKEDVAKQFFDVCCKPLKWTEKEDGSMLAVERLSSDEYYVYKVEKM